MIHLPMTAALSPLAEEQGVDISAFAKLEAEFERMLQEARDWLRSISLEEEVELEGVCAELEGGAMPSAPALALRAEPKVSALRASIRIAGGSQ